jgi:hypothetical protein
MAYSRSKFRVLNQFNLNFDHLIKRNFSLSMSDAISKAEIILGYSIKDLSVKQIANNSKMESLTIETSFSNNEHPIMLAER